MGRWHPLGRKRQVAYNDNQPRRLSKSTSDTDTHRFSPITMPRRYSFLFAGLLIAFVLIGLVWAGLASQGRETQQTAASAPVPITGPSLAIPAGTTLTPSVLTPQPTVAVAVNTPTPLETKPAAVTPLPRPAATLAAVAPTPEASPPATAAPTTVRVDAAGPLSLPTIQPLLIGQGRAPARLLIPALGLDTPVLPMGWHVVEDASGVRSEWDVVDNAAGHHIDSVYAGEAGNVVLSGHNNIGGAVFRTVCVIGEPGVDFGLGDEMIVQDEAGRSFVYQVEGWQRFAEEGASIAQRQTHARYLAPTDRAQLTLVTCWPPSSNTHRVVVTGVLTGMR